MKKTSLIRALFAAGVVAMAGAAHADAIFYPDGTMVDLGGDTALELTADDSLSPGVDTTVLGAPASVRTTTTTVPIVEYVYVQPNIDWDRNAVLSQMRNRDPAMARSGSVIVGSTAIPSAAITVGEPYYVLSH